MIRLEKENYDSLYKLYQSREFFFPLIGAVLLDEQDGAVYVDEQVNPSQAYVEHAFGFAQVFGAITEKFESELEKYLLADKQFVPKKVRLYGTYLPRFLNSPDLEFMRSYRQRFFIGVENFSAVQSICTEVNKDVDLYDVDIETVSMIEDKFGVAGRFWRSSKEFILKSNAVVISYKGEPASICYAAAEADQRVEIDVVTLPEFRNLGLAKRAVEEFVRRCFRLSLHPLWDCFTNNAGSMNLCKSVGFAAATAPYPFYTINKGD